MFLALQSKYSHHLVRSIYKMSIPTENTLNLLIASKNPVKISACREGFSEIFKNAKIICKDCKSDSKVSAQPIGEKETRQGAINRVIDALDKYKQENSDSLPSFVIGLEGGVKDESIFDEHQISRNSMVCFAWIAVLRPSDMKWGFGRTGSFIVPPNVQELVNKGMELGVADDLVFSRKNSGQNDGTVGILTNGIINRSIFYTQAVSLSLIPFINPDLY